MLVILSPAKDMFVDRNSIIEQFTMPQFINKANELMRQLKVQSPMQLQELMKVSEKLAMQNYERIQNWHKNHGNQNAGLSILSYTGEAYRGLSASDFSVDELIYSQKVLRILSGLYGILRPLDLIQEYRLEMGTKQPFSGKKNLYEFWGDSISKEIEHAVLSSPGDKVLVNAASNEYSKAILSKNIKIKQVEVSFLEEKDGKSKMVTVYTKKARGMFARFVVKNKIEQLDELKSFDSEGYYFDTRRSSGQHLVFIR